MKVLAAMHCVFFNQRLASGSFSATTGSIRRWSACYLDIHMFIHSEDDCATNRTAKLAEYMRDEGEIFVLLPSQLIGGYTTPISPISW
jgi:hypothetical protein